MKLNKNNQFSGGEMYTAVPSTPPPKWNRLLFGCFVTALGHVVRLGEVGPSILYLLADGALPPRGTGDPALRIPIKRHKKKSDEKRL